MLRHSCGDGLTPKGTDLRTMQGDLGYRNSKHTAHYTCVLDVVASGARA